MCVYTRTHAHTHTHTHTHLAEGLVFPQPELITVPIPASRSPIGESNTSRARVVWRDALAVHVIGLIHERRLRRVNHLGLVRQGPIPI